MNEKQKKMNKNLGTFFVVANIIATLLILVLSFIFIKSGVSKRIIIIFLLFYFVVFYFSMRKNIRMIKGKESIGGLIGYYIRKNAT